MSNQRQGKGVRKHFRWNVEYRVGSRLFLICTSDQVVMCECDQNVGDCMILDFGKLRLLNHVLLRTFSTMFLYLVINSAGRFDQYEDQRLDI